MTKISTWNCASLFNSAHHLTPIPQKLQRSTIPGLHIINRRLRLNNPILLQEARADSKRFRHLRMHFNHSENSQRVFGQPLDNRNKAGGLLILLPDSPKKVLVDKTAPSGWWQALAYLDNSGRTHALINVHGPHLPSSKIEFIKSVFQEYDSLVESLPVSPTIAGDFNINFTSADNISKTPEGSLLRDEMGERGLADALSTLKPGTHLD